mgnify:CR=1 FL=1
MTQPQKKYEFTGETREHLGCTLHRIRALVAIASIGVSAGDLGGWIEAEKNLSHDGDAWVYGNAEVFWFSHVGSEGGTLTVFRTRDGALVNRGCFTGTVDEFAAAVERRHSDSQHGMEYRALIEMIRIRVASWPERQTEDAA